MMLFVPQHSFFKISKALKLLRVFTRKNCTVPVEIFGASPSPRTLGKSQHVRIKGILSDHILLGHYYPILPHCHDSPGYIITTLRLIVNATVIQSYYISKYVKMIQVVEP